MKQRVDFSTYSFVGTIITLGVLAAVFFMPVDGFHSVESWYIGWGVVVSILLICSLYYCPLSVEVTDEAIIVNRALPFHNILLPLDTTKNIATVTHNSLNINFELHIHTHQPHPHPGTKQQVILS